jgi:hypothetical protein
MIGLIHVILFDLLHELGGDAAAKEVRARAQVPETRTFRINQVYDDAEWRRIYDATLETLGLDEEALNQVYSEAFVGDAMRRWPTWFARSPSARSLIELQPVIHNSFATGLRDVAERRAVDDKFLLERHPQRVVVHYRSPNRHCTLYIALVRRVLEQYGEQAWIREPQCTRRGDTECEIHIDWDPAAAHGSLA